jgi:hypothetical protein
MGLFSFIEIFFFISLGVTILLIALLVYHFKQRLSSLEQKYDSLFEIVSNVVKQLRNIQSLSNTPARETELFRASPVIHQESSIYLGNNSSISSPEQYPPNIFHQITEPLAESSKFIMNYDNQFIRETPQVHNTTGSEDESDDENDSESDIEPGSDSDSDSGSDSDSDSDTESDTIPTRVPSVVIGSLPGESEFHRVNNTIIVSDDDDEASIKEEHHAEIVAIPVLGTSVGIGSFSGKQLEEREQEFRRMKAMEFHNMNDDVRIIILPATLESAENDSNMQEIELQTEELELLDVHDIESRTQETGVGIGSLPAETRSNEFIVQKVENDEIGQFLSNEPSSTTNKELYKKMTLPNLKATVIAKGLCSDPSKMKKADLLKLLEEE